MKDTFFPGWLIGVLAAASALNQGGAPKPSVVLLVVAALVFSLNHEPPLGPIAFGCFFLAVARMEFGHWDCIRQANAYSSRTNMGSL